MLIPRSSRQSVNRCRAAPITAPRNPLEVEWAELITSLVPSAEKVRFTASGTEAVMLALRVARAATGRDRIVKLQEHFHGWSDVVSPYLDADGRTRTPAGVPEALGALTTVVRNDDPADLEATLAARRRRGGDHGTVRRALRPAPARSGPSSPPRVPRAPRPARC